VLSRDDDVTLVKVDGLLCDAVCAVRTSDALSHIDGVNAVSVDFKAGVARVTGRAASAEEYERAVSGVVAGRGLRRLLECVAHWKMAGAVRSPRRFSRKTRDQLLTHPVDAEPDA
jgi:hypothetical protein